jgi:hypothetical protein
MSYFYFFSYKLPKGQTKLLSSFHLQTCLGPTMLEGATHAPLNHCLFAFFKEYFLNHFNTSFKNIIKIF